MRVVSLVPSVTETLLAWGIEPVACTRFCEQPALRTVGGTKDPDVEAIVGLSPDLVVVDEEENRREDADALAAAGTSLHVTAVRSVDDVAPTLAALAAALRVPDPPDGQAWGRGPHALEEARSAGAAKPQKVLLAFVPIWRRPWMTINHDTYGSSVLERVGIGNVFADAPERYPSTTLEEALERAPDLVLAPSEPYPFKQRHVAELSSVAPVTLVDGKDLFWWGVRTPDALLRLGLS